MTEVWHCTVCMKSCHSRSWYASHGKLCWLLVRFLCGSWQIFTHLLAAIFFRRIFGCGKNSVNPNIWHRLGSPYLLHKWQLWCCHVGVLLRQPRRCTLRPEWCQLRGATGVCGVFSWIFLLLNRIPSLWALNRSLLDVEMSLEVCRWLLFALDTIPLKGPECSEDKRTWWNTGQTGLARCWELESAGISISVGYSMTVDLFKPLQL